MILLSILFKRDRLVLGLFIASFLAICFISINTFFSILPAQAASPSRPQVVPLSQLQIQNIQKQSTKLYERLKYQKHSQSEIDAALLQQFGLQRVVTKTTSPKATSPKATPFTSNSQDVSLPSSTTYSSRGATFVYSDFSWNNSYGAAAYESGPYDDVFGAWFSRNVPAVSSAYLEITDIIGNTQDYFNPSNISSAGADFNVPDNHWVSGILSISLRGNFPGGCTNIYTKYTHGWSTSEVTSTTLTVGVPGSAGIGVTYSQVAHSWQAMGGTPAIRCI